jgi:hypothetical protein
MKRKSKLTIATGALAVLGGAVVYAQDKYSLVTDRRKSDNDCGVQGRHSRQRPGVPGWLAERNRVLRLQGI